MKLSVCIITGPSETIINTLECIECIADEICITQTCEHKPTMDLIDAFYERFPNKVKYECKPELMHEDGFLRSFAEARNENWRLATGDLIMWLDTDDTIYDPISLRDEIERLNDIGCDRITMDYDYEFDELGQCTTRHSRERILRNGYFKWIAPIHEVTTPLRRATTANISRNISYVIHHNIIGEGDEGRRERNLKMLTRIVKEEPDHARMKMYYANALADVGEYDQADYFYKEYLQASQWNQERYQVMLRLFNLHRKHGDSQNSKFWALEAMALFPQYKGAYMAMAELSAQNEKWEDVIEWVTIMDQRLEEDASMMHNPAGLKVHPWVLLQQAYLKLGDFEKSYQATLELMHLIPNKREQLEAFGNKCLKQIGDMKLVKAYQSVIHATPEEDRQLFYDNVPERIADYPDFLKNKSKLRDPSKKTVAIYCGYDETRTWGPEDIKTGIGGSEEAVINVSRIFAEKGWNVEVYCNCTTEGLKDGVHWYQTASANPEDKVDLLIAWRGPHLVLNAPKGEQTWLWLHDLQYGQEAYYDEDIMNQIDKVMFLSEFHRNTAPWVKDEKVFITGNGVDPNLMVDGDNDINTVIYASSPDRGLDTLLEMWPKVTKAKPEARLKVFYGFNAWFDKRYENNPEMMEWKNSLLMKMEKDPTIEYIGSVGQDVLAKEISQAGVWAYPTTFGEISCITAMKMQCGGAIPVSTTTGALAETVRYGLRVAGTEKDFNKDAFLTELIYAVGNEEYQYSVRDAMKESSKRDFRWDSIVDSWIKKFNESEVKHGISV